MEPSTRVTFPRWVFLVAGIYGLIVLLPQYFLESEIGTEQPPAITHPEYFYGFVGLAVVWQIVFLCIARNPVRYRLLMIPAILEKLAFAIPTLILLVQGRISGPVPIFGFIDFVLGGFFLAAYVRTPRGDGAR
jgi:hypothetical protein